MAGVTLDLKELSAYVDGASAQMSGCEKQLLANIVASTGPVSIQSLVSWGIKYRSEHNIRVDVKHFLAKVADDCAVVVDSSISIADTLATRFSFPRPEAIPLLRPTTIRDRIIQRRPRPIGPRSLRCGELRLRGVFGPIKAVPGLPYLETNALKLMYSIRGAATVQDAGMVYRPGTALRLQFVSTPCFHFTGR